MCPYLVFHSCADTKLSGLENKQDGKIFSLLGTERQRERLSYLDFPGLPSVWNQWGGQLRCIPQDIFNFVQDSLCLWPLKMLHFLAVSKSLESRALNFTARCIVLSPQEREGSQAIQTWGKKRRKNAEQAITDTHTHFFGLEHNGLADLFSCLSSSRPTVGLPW